MVVAEENEVAVGSCAAKKAIQKEEDLDAHGLSILCHGVMTCGAVVPGASRNSGVLPMVQCDALIVSFRLVTGVVTKLCSCSERHGLSSFEHNG